MQEPSRGWYAGVRRAAVDTQLRMSVGSYGYGLVASTNCRFPRIVWHSGGLPGYGSYMQWLPQQDVGLIFMSNRTYGAGGGVVNDAMEALWKTGGLKPRPVVPSTALLAAQNDASKLLLQWNEQDAKRLVSDNFFLDRSSDDWQKESAELSGKHGTCTTGAIDAENALRGRWRLDCERGWIDVGMTLAPTTPPRIQDLDDQVGVLHLFGRLLAGGVHVARVPLYRHAVLSNSLVSRYFTRLT